MATLPTIVRQESLAQQAYSAIRRAIREGKMARGQFFSENTLAESLGVSRTPVREALLNLYSDGVVEIVPKRGYRLVELDDDAIYEIRLLRVALEQIVVARLCEVATHEMVAELRRILGGKGRSQGDIYSIDEAFHVRMAELADLRQIGRQLLSVRGKMFLLASGARVPAMRNTTVATEHQEIIDAIERHDAEAAKRLIAAHVERSIDSFIAARVPRQGFGQLDRIS